ncbi:MAG: UpxY family transcription antiterminator [Candidatus Omnitrophota bacterium]|nr:UpxY family transcription antiterminator [Candidatus Omnitrophota bacterium]
MLSQARAATDSLLVAPSTIPHWFALYTRSRHEKVVQRELAKRGIETFLPLRKFNRRWSDRKKIIEEPLFKGYIFTHAALIDRWTIMNTVGVVSFVGPTKARPMEVPEKELLAIKKFVEEDIPLDPYPYLKEGRRVYIRSGPFKGIEGFIVQKGRHCRLVISLELLAQSASVEVDSANVEPL